jgi:hypothetical protein
MLLNLLLKKLLSELFFCYLALSFMGSQAGALEPVAKKSKMILFGLSLK